MPKWTQADLSKLLEKMRSAVVVKVRALREFVGGVPAEDSRLEGFIEFQMGIVPQRKDGAPTNPAFIECLQRLKKDEIGERNVTPEGGEVEERKVYGVNVIRKSAAGHFILEHQIKAVLKQAASRKGLFMAKKGSKGDLAEFGTVLAVGESLQVKDRPWEIYLRKDGKPITTRFRTMRGHVASPSGSKSIQYEAECAPEGTEFSFELSWPPKKLKENDVVDIVAVATAIGFGSCLSKGYGKFEVLSMETVRTAEKEEKE